MAEKKPRICEILGVEVGQQWEIDGNGMGGTVYRVNEDGIIEGYDQGTRYWETVVVSIRDICDVINGKWEITHKPFWTEQDREAARILMYILPQAHTVKRTDLGRLVAVQNTLGETTINSNMFPTLKVGNSATIAEILGSAET